MGSSILSTLGNVYSFLPKDIAPVFPAEPAKQSSPPLPVNLAEAGGSAHDAAPPFKSASEIQAMFDAAVYSARIQQTALSVSAQQTAARHAVQNAGNDPGTSNAAQQTFFRFFAEARVEELALFRQRAAETADRLEGATRESYIEASRRVAMRFSVSLEISGAALNGFAKTAAGLAQGSSALFDRFLSFANQALGEDNALLNMLFELLNGFFSGKNDIQGRFEELLAQLSGLVSGSFPALHGPCMVQVAEARSETFRFQLEFEFIFEERTVAASGQVKESDPITLDLNNDGITLTTYRNGAWFDITGDGKKVATAFVTGGDAFLAIDRNGNGIIDNGKELFGDQNGAQNGFEELRKLDSNGDGRINAQDNDFALLRLWKDNGNGITEPGELVTLAQQGITEIDLGYRNVQQAASGGNRIAQIAAFLRDDGTRGLAADVVLNYLA